MPRPPSSVCPCGATFVVSPVGRPTYLCVPCRARRKVDYSKVRQRRAREENSEVLREYHRKKTAEWRARNPDYRHPYTPEQRRAQKLRRKYGLSVAEYESLLAGQGGGCAICGRSCSSGRRLAVDHCHRTGMVRGLLCKACNTAIGFLEDSTHLLDRAKVYLLERAEATDEAGRKGCVVAVFRPA